jgi:glycine cleavage system protein P-like pyridoxal-binding family
MKKVFLPTVEPRLFDVGQGVCGPNTPSNVQMTIMVTLTGTATHTDLDLLIQSLQNGHQPVNGKAAKVRPTNPHKFTMIHTAAGFGLAGG